MRGLLIFVIWTTILVNSYGQSGEQHTWVHFDKPFYATGETIWFNCFLPSNIQFDSALIGVNVLNPVKGNNELFYIEASKSNADGYFKIPYDWKSNNCQFTFFVREQGDQKRNILTSHVLPIYSDLEPVTSPLDTGLILSDRSVSVQNNQLDLKLTKKSYVSREKVSISVKAIGQNLSTLTHLSISVTDAGLIKSSAGSIIQGHEIKSTAQIEKDIVVSGRVFYTDKPNQKHSIGMSSFNQYEGVMNLFATNKEGQFSLNLSPYIGQRAIQFQDYFGGDVTVELNDGLSVTKADLVPRYTAEIINYLELSKKRKKINQLNNLEELAQPPAKISYINVLEPDRSLVLTDYEKFDDLVDFFSNVVTPLKVHEEKDGSLTYKMVNPKDKPYFPGSPLFIVDRHIIQDNSYIKLLDMDNIKQIDLFYDKPTLNYLFGHFGTGGVVSVFTKEGSDVLPEKYKSNIFTISGKQPSLYFKELSYDAEDETTPYFRPTIYWNPAVSTTIDRTAEVSFYHSDDKGRFRVEVFGLTEAGEPLRAVEYYEVP